MQSLGGQVGAICADARRSRRAGQQGAKLSNAAGCGAGLECVRGVRCADGCSDLSCCSNTCAEPGCEGPAPVGCEIKCEEGCSKCVVHECRCLEDEWDCAGQCTDPAFEFSCEF